METGRFHALVICSERAADQALAAVDVLAAAVDARRTG
jgi:hypothetical protein